MTPTLSSGIITDNWQYLNENKEIITKSGTWLHLSEEDMINLLLFLEE